MTPQSKPIVINIELIPRFAASTILGLFSTRFWILSVGLLPIHPDKHL